MRRAARRDDDDRPPRHHGAGRGHARRPALPQRRDDHGRRRGRPDAEHRHRPRTTSSPTRSSIRRCRAAPTASTIARSCCRRSATGTITITDNYITGSQTGLFGTASWGRGIWFDGGGVDLNVTGNTIEFSRTGLNLEMGGSSDATVQDNTFRSDGTAISVGADPGQATLLRQRRPERRHRVQLPQPDDGVSRSTPTRRSTRVTGRRQPDQRHRRRSRRLGQRQPVGHRRRRLSSTATTIRRSAQRSTPTRSTAAAATTSCSDAPATTAHRRRRQRHDRRRRRQRH